MRIAVLGPLELTRDDGTPVVVAGAKERLLLAALTAGAPGVVSTDRLTEVLWDGVPPPTARKSLQAHLAHLRSALEPDRPKGSPGRYIARRGPGYALTVAREDVDALHVGDLAVRGRAHLASGQAGAAVEELTAARDLWRGDPYADWPDAPFAEVERRRLAEVRTGALTGLLEARLVTGQHADVLPELERLVAEEPLQECWWRLLMVALYRAGRQADALAAGRRVRTLLAEELGAEPGPALRDVEAAILAQDRRLELPGSPAEPTSSGGPPDGSVCPYKGLAAYQAADARLFRGRRRLVAGMVARLVDAPLLVVSGPSGAGKSSVVRAGLVPALAAGALPGSAGWRSVVLTPGRQPVDTLAGLAEDDGPVLLVVDQAEELWAPGVDPVERTAFLDAVLGLLDDGVVVRCVVVLRGDSVGRLAEHAAFTARLDGRVVLVPALTEPELREIVREPAAAVGLAVEADLVDAVVADVLGRTSALPLLSTALVGTWERRRRNTLTLAGYLAAGGVEGALIRTAEAAYAQLDAAGRELARRLLVRLADVDDTGQLVRRPLPLGEFDGTDPARHQVVEAFVARRLVTVDGKHLEVAHEALLTAWPRLARWLEDDAAGRAVRRHLAPAARDWDAGGRPDDELYRGARLAAALDWGAREDADPTPVEREFLEASRAHVDAELEAAHHRADTEAAARRRTRLLARTLAAMLAALLVVVVIAVRSQRDAEARGEEAARAARVADANRLATLSGRAGPLDVALLLAAQAVRLAETPETRDGLLSALVEYRRVERMAALPSPVDDAVLAEDGTLFLATSLDWTVWSSAEPRPRPALQLSGDWRGLRSTAASPVEDLLVAAGTDNEGRPWVRSLSAAGEDRLLLDGPAVGGVPFGVSFTADGRRLRLLVVPPGQDGSSSVIEWRLMEVDLAGGRAIGVPMGGTVPARANPFAHMVDDSVVIWAGGPDGTGADGGAGATLVDLVTSRQVPLQSPRRDTLSLGFRALPSGAAQLWFDGAVTLYDRDGAVLQQLDAHREFASDVEVSPDGAWAVTAGGEPEVLLWDVDPVSGLWTQREALAGHAGIVTSAEIALDGDRLFTVSSDEAIAWDLRADGGFGDSYPGLPGRWVAGRPEVVEPGRLVVVPTRPVSRTGGGSRLDPPADTRSVSATFIDPGTGRVVAEVPVGDLPGEPTVTPSVAVSPDRRRVAVTTGLVTTVLDTGTREEVARIQVTATGGARVDGQPRPAAVVTCVEWAPDGSRLLLCVQDTSVPGSIGDLVLVDPETGDVGAGVGFGGAARASALSPDGRLLAVASASRPAVIILDAETLDHLRDVQLRATDTVEDLSFAPDGGMLAVVGLGGLLQLVDPVRGEPVGEPVRFAAPLLQAEWLADGETVVVAALDGTVSLFDAGQGLARTSRMPASGDVAESHVHLLPGAAEELVAFSGELPGRRYPLEPAAWLAEACAIVARDLTRAEWERYLPGRPYQPTCSDLG